MWGKGSAPFFATCPFSSSFYICRAVDFLLCLRTVMSLFPSLHIGSVHCVVPSHRVCSPPRNLTVNLSPPFVVLPSPCTFRIMLIFGTLPLRCQFAGANAIALTTHTPMLTRTHSPPNNTLPAADLVLLVPVWTEPKVIFDFDVVVLATVACIYPPLSFSTPTTTAPTTTR
jgi:hypothetical protein